MRFVLCLVISMMTWATTVQAKSKPAPNRFDGRLITYQQFMRLNTDARRAYLAELQDILVLLEKNQARFQVASNDSSLWRLKEQIASFIKMAELLPAASAETVGPVNTGVQRPNVPRWNSLQGKWTCDPAPPYTFDPTLGTCIMQYERRGQMLSDWTDACPIDLVPVQNPNLPTVRCVPKDSWKSLSRSRRKEITTGVRFSPDFFDGEDSDFGRKYTHGGGVYENDGSTVAGRPADGPGVGTNPTAGPQPEPPTVPDGGQPVAPQSAPPDVAAPAEPPAPAPEPQPAPPTPEPPPAPVCKLDKLTCEDLPPREKQRLIEAFRRDQGADTCVAGGFFTKKRGRAIRGKGSCELVTSMKVDKADPRNPKGVMNSCGKDPVTKKDTAMCNPAVFCVGLKASDKVREQMLSGLNADRRKAMDAALAAAAAKKGKDRKGKPIKLTPQEEKAIRDQFVDLTAQQLDQANVYKTIDGTDDKLLTMTFCAPISQQLTASCDQMLQEHLDGKRGVPGYVGEGYEYVQCDPTKIKGFPLQDEWNKLAEETYEAYKKQCGSSESNSRFRSLFCEECNAVGERIFKANQKAIGSGCAEVAARPGQPPAPGNGEAVRERGTNVFDE